MGAALKQLTTHSDKFGIAVAAGTTQTIYENDVVATTAILKQLTFCNTAETPASLTVSIKGSADAMALSNAIFYKASLPAGQTAVIDMSSVIAFGKNLDVKVEGIGGAVNVTAHGVELLNATAKQLISAMLDDTYAIAYETPADKESTMYQIFAVNGDTAEASMSVQIVPPAGQIDVKNCLLYEVKIQPSETFMFSTKTPLPAGYKIVVKASRKNIIHMLVDGTEK